MYQGGISRAAVRRLIARAHGRTCSNVLNGIGATPFLRWQFSQDRCRIGAMSFVKVTGAPGFPCPAASSLVATAPTTATPTITRHATARRELFALIVTFTSTGTWPHGHRMRV